MTTENENLAMEAILCPGHGPTRHWYCEAQLKQVAAALEAAEIRGAKKAFEKVMKEVAHYATTAKPTARSAFESIASDC